MGGAVLDDARRAVHPYAVIVAVGCHVVDQDAVGGGIRVDGVGGAVVVIGAAGDSGVRTVHIDRVGAAVVMDRVRREVEGVVARAYPDAARGIAVYLTGVDGEIVHGGAVVRIDAVSAAGDGEVLEGHVVGAGEREDIAAGGGVAPIEDGLVAGLGRTQDGYARVGCGEGDVGGDGVASRIDVDGVTGVKVIGAQQCREARHWGIGCLARVGVIPHCRGIFIADGTPIVHVVHLPFVGDEEGLVRGIGCRAVV